METRGLLLLGGRAAAACPPALQQGGEPELRSSKVGRRAPPSPPPGLCVAAGLCVAHLSPLWVSVCVEGWVGASCMAGFGPRVVVVVGVVAICGARFLDSAGEGYKSRGVLLQGAGKWTEGRCMGKLAAEMPGGTGVGGAAGVDLSWSLAWSREATLLRPGDVGGTGDNQPPVGLKTAPRLSFPHCSWPAPD